MRHRNPLPHLRRRPLRHRDSRPGPVPSRQRVTAILFLAPSVAGTLLFFAAPFMEVVRRSFCNDAAVAFTGLDNYAAVAESGAFQLAVGNTAAFVAVCLPLLLALSLGAALLLQKAGPVRSLLTSALLLPLALPVFATALLIVFAFGPTGPVNSSLGLLGAPSVPWLESDAAFWVLVATYLGKNLGYATVLWLAALSCIPAPILEAARIDSANPWQRLTRVTLPLLAPASLVVVILSAINALKVYREAYLVAGSYPPEGIYLIPHLFNQWLADLALGKLAAASALIAASLLLGGALLLIVQRLIEGKR